MASHVFHEIYLHINWHVKDDRPTLTDDVETLTHKILADRCRRMNGVYLHGLNGTATHVHLAVNIEPHVTISEMVKNLKGGSSYDVNSQLAKKLLQWQRGYGVVSFGPKNLPWVLKYIDRQKEHHANHSALDRLERINAYEDDSDTAV